MRTIGEDYVATVEVKRSKFIAHLVRYDAFKYTQEQLKREHPKANHIVYAYRYLNTFDQTVEQSSDDGEPKGCAGVPALNVLRGEELVNIAVLVVRYFGGIKLGTGGMARAYALAVKEVLSIAAIVPYEKQVRYTFETSYVDIDKMLYQLKQVGIIRFEREFKADGVRWSIVATQQQIEKMQGLGFRSMSFAHLSNNGS